MRADHSPELERRLALAEVITRRRPVYGQALEPSESSQTMLASPTGSLGSMRLG
jgi:hypothetical protein